MDKERSDKVKILTITLLVGILIFVWWSGLIEIPNLMIAGYINHNSRIFINHIWLYPMIGSFQKSGWETAHMNDDKHAMLSILVRNSSDVNWTDVDKFISKNKGKYIILDYECRGNAQKCDPYVYYRMIKKVKPNETVTLPPEQAVFYSDPFQYIINNVPNVYLMEYDEDSSIFSMYRDCKLFKEPKFYLYARDVDFLFRLYVADKCGAEVTIWT